MQTAEPGRTCAGGWRGYWGTPTKSSAWPFVALLLTLAPLALAQMPKGYGLWLNEDVTYIVQPEERRAFEPLRTDEEREQSVIQFLARRDPTPGTAVNEAKEEHYRRIQWTNAKCKEPGSNNPGWATEKGRTYIVFGPPDEIEVHPEQNNEQWFYKKIPGVGANVTIEFGPRRVRR